MFASSLPRTERRSGDGAERQTGELLGVLRQKPKGQTRTAVRLRPGQRQGLDRTRAMRQGDVFQTQ